MYKTTSSRRLHKRSDARGARAGAILHDIHLNEKKNHPQTQFSSYTPFSGGGPSLSCEGLTDTQETYQYRSQGSMSPTSEVLHHVASTCTRDACMQNIGLPVRKHRQKPSVQSRTVSRGVSHQHAAPCWAVWVPFRLDGGSSGVCVRISAQLHRLDVRQRPVPHGSGITAVVERNASTE